MGWNVCPQRVFVAGGGVLSEGFCGTGSDVKHSGTFALMRSVDLHFCILLVVSMSTPCV